MGEPVCMACGCLVPFALLPGEWFCLECAHAQMAGVEAAVVLRALKCPPVRLDVIDEGDLLDVAVSPQASRPTQCKTGYVQTDSSAKARSASRRRSPASCASQTPT